MQATIPPSPRPGPRRLESERTAHARTRIAVALAPEPDEHTPPGSEPLAAAPRSTAGPVLRLAILIADTAGEILFSNPEAEEALEKLSRSVRCLDDIFTPEALERLSAKRSWAAVSPRQAAHLTWRVRARHMIDSGRSLFLFFADEPAAR